MSLNKKDRQVSNRNQNLFRHYTISADNHINSDGKFYRTEVPLPDFSSLCDPIIIPSEG